MERRCTGSQSTSEPADSGLLSGYGCADTALSVEQYLATSFPDLDKEYRDGQLVERSRPDNLHSKTQALLVAFFVALRKTLPVFARPELRMKIRPGL